MPLLNRVFNFFISDVLYSFPVVTILLSLRSYKVKVRLLRFFVVIYTEFITDNSFFVSVFLS